MRKATVKKAGKIIMVGLAIVILTAPLSATALKQEMMCYENKFDDGFVVKTRYEVIMDFCNGIRYEEIQVKP